MIAVILDRRPEFLFNTDSGASLLTLPMASSSVLDQLASRILEKVDGELLVLPQFPADPAYAERLAECTAFGVRLVSPEQLAAEWKEAEPVDILAVLDAARWPTEGFDLAELLRQRSGYRGALHAVAVGADVERTRERVECDAQGNVRRVQRFYNRMTWPEAAAGGLFLSMVPVRALGDEPLRTLSDLRAGLAKRGMLTCDEPVATDLIDLASEEGFLAVHERMVADGVHHCTENGFRFHDPATWVGQDAVVDPSVRISGPVLVYPGAVVEGQVTLIGPTVVGPRCRVSRGSVVAQCVLAAGTVVEERTTVSRHVLSGRGQIPARNPSSGRRHGPAHAPLGGYHAWDDDSALPNHVVPASKVHPITKRALDLVVSILSLVVLSPLLIVIALVLKLDSRGPVFFGHRREQKGSKEFSCWKFRTMTTGADRMQRALAAQNEVDGPQFKMENDPRVTRVGRILRATNLDELPQLFNVLLGHMSLVGPRPSPFRENQICVPWRRARLSVRPGITGLWQVCRGNRSAADFNQWIFYDILYVRHFSIGLDLKILLATLLTLGGKWSVPLTWIIPANSRSAGASSPVLAA